MTAVYPLAEKVSTHLTAMEAETVKKTTKRIRRKPTQPTASARVTYEILQRNSKNPQQYAYIKYRTLAKWRGLTKTTIYNHVCQLRAAGWLKTEQDESSQILAFKCLLQELPPLPEPKLSQAFLDLDVSEVVYTVVDTVAHTVDSTVVDTDIHYMTSSTPVTSITKHNNKKQTPERKAKGKRVVVFDLSKYPEEVQKAFSEIRSTMPDFFQDDDKGLALFIERHTAEKALHHLRAWKLESKRRQVDVGLYSYYVQHDCAHKIPPTPRSNAQSSPQVVTGGLERNVVTSAPAPAEKPSDGSGRKAFLDALKETGRIKHGAGAALSPQGRANV